MSQATYVGKMMGVKSDSFTNKKTGEVRTEQVVGIGYRKDRSFEDDVDVFNIKLDKEISKESVEKLNKLRGKMVSIGCSMFVDHIEGK